MRLSVIIPSYNSRRTIERCLASVRAQRTSAPFEVIVVDSSSDGTAEIIRRVAPEVSLYCLDGRRYPGDARNLGLKHSRGEIIGFTDTDCVLPPDWVDSVLEAHDRNPEMPVIGGLCSRALSMPPDFPPCRFCCSTGG